MDVTLQRRLLYGAAAGCVLLAAITVIWSFGSLPGSPSASSVRPPASLPKRSALQQPTSTATGAQSAVDFSLPIQQTLYDPPPPPPKPKPKPKPAVVRPPTSPPAPRLNWTLLGTIIEPRRRVAILEDASGKTDIRAVGEEVDLVPAGVLVRKIDSEAVTLEHRGNRSTLRLKQDFATGGGGPSRGARRRNR